MDFAELVKKNRTFRRFNQARAVSMDELEALADLARHTASAGNLQPLKFVLANSAVDNALIFSCLGWAAYYKNWPGPGEGERPAAYIVILGDTDIARTIDCDHGIAAQTIMLGAAERGLGGCILANVDRKRLKRELGLPERLDILLVLALGEPAETVRLTDLGPDGDVKYFMDEEGVHCVPKRSLDELVVGRNSLDNDRTLNQK